VPAKALTQPRGGGRNSLEGILKSLMVSASIAETVFEKFNFISLIYSLGLSRFQCETWSGSANCFRVYLPEVP
jgi:hypothetical protein